VFWWLGSAFAKNVGDGEEYDWENKSSKFGMCKRRRVENSEAVLENELKQCGKECD